MCCEYLCAVLCVDVPCRASMCVNLPQELYFGATQEEKRGSHTGRPGKNRQGPRWCGNKGQRTLTNANTLANPSPFLSTVSQFADPNALQKSSLLPERPCVKRLQPSSHAPLHTPPTLVQLKQNNFQFGNLTPGFHWTFSVATVLHSLT